MDNLPLGTEYIVLSGSAGDLTRKVNQHLKELWKLYGDLAGTYGEFAQAMVRVPSDKTTAAGAPILSPPADPTSPIPKEPGKPSPPAPAQQKHQ